MPILLLGQYQTRWRSICAIARSGRLAFWLAAAGILVSLLAALTLPRKASTAGL